MKWVKTLSASFFLIEFFFLLGACSQGQTKLINIENKIQYHTNQDFSDHWELLGDDFRKAHNSKIILLSYPSKKYLKGLTRKIKLNNKLLLDDFHGEEILLVREQRPFHFSVPGGKIFLSLGLLKKYIKHEGLLASILIIEMIKSHKKIFVKNIRVPTGAISFEELRPLLKIRVALRNEINKWTTYTLKKSGFDPLALLGLLQTKNKNFLDFFDNRDESKNVSIEEAELKNFLIRSNLFRSTDRLLKNSSKGFYYFINEVKKI